MKIVDKYLLREYLANLSYCLATFCMLFVVFDLFDRIAKILDAGMSLPRVLAFYMNFLLGFNGNVSVFVAILPASLLLAAMYTLSRFSRSNELIAMLAGGIGTLQIMRPFLAVGLTASLIALAAQELAAPAATRRILEVDNHLSGRPPAATIEDFAYVNKPAGRRWFVRTVDAQTHATLRHLRITEENEAGVIRRVIRATRADWLDRTWWLTNLEIQSYTESGEPLGPPAVVPDRPVEMRHLTETPADFARDTRPWETLSARDMLSYIRHRPALSSQNLARYMTDFHSRLAFPWTCLIVTLLAVPAGALVVRQNLMMRAMLSLAFFFSFFALMHIGIFLGKREVLSPWLAAWLPNAAFGTIGIRLLVLMR